MPLSLAPIESKPIPKGPAVLTGPSKGLPVAALDCAGLFADAEHLCLPLTTQPSKETLLMAITGVHALLYSTQAEQLRSLLGDVLGLGHVDDGQDAGWLIFKLPPAELRVHLADGPSHEISLTCDNLETTIAELGSKGVMFKGDPVDEGWGVAVK